MGYALECFGFVGVLNRGDLVGRVWWMFGVLFQYALCNLFGKSVIIPYLKG